MAAPRSVFTIARAAEMLSESIDLLHEIADRLEPEDDCLWIYNTDERTTLGFTMPLPWLPFVDRCVVKQGLR